MGHALPDWLVMGLLQTLNRKDIKQMFCCDLKLLRWRLWVWLVYAWIVSNDPFLKPVLRAVTVQVEPNAGASARNVLDISQTAVPASPLSFFYLFFFSHLFFQPELLEVSILWFITLSGKMSMLVQCFLSFSPSLILLFTSNTGFLKVCVSLTDLYSIHRCGFVASRMFPQIPPTDQDVSKNIWR